MMKNHMINNEDSRAEDVPPGCRSLELSLTDTGWTEIYNTRYALYADAGYTPTTCMRMAMIEAESVVDPDGFRERYRERCGRYPGERPTSRDDGAALDREPRPHWSVRSPAERTRVIFGEARDV